MHIFMDHTDLPKRSEIKQFTTTNRTIYGLEVDQWIAYLESQGEILLQVVCEDGFVALVRIIDFD